MSETRVLICDDHALFRRGLVMALEGADDVEVVAEASDGDEAVELGRSLAPDVVLMDVRMPAVDGITATRRLLEHCPSMRVVMLSVSDDDDDLFEALKAGAVGYLLKEHSLEEVVGTVRAVAAGHSLVSPELARSLIEEFGRMAHRESPVFSSATPNLTGRELDVLRLLADGGTNAGIAQRLGMTVSGARNHVRNVLEKLQLHTRAEAVLYAVRERLIEP